jgi:hypothetical protein
VNKITIVSDFTKNDEWSFWARNEIGHLKGHLDISVRCAKKSRSEGSLDGSDMVLHFSENPTYIPNYFNVGCGPDEFGLMDALIKLPPLIVPPPYFDSPLKIRPLEGEFVIYTINSRFDRSNTLQLVEEFSRQFDPSEPVTLLIKTDRAFENEINGLKAKMALYPNISSYKKEIVIHGALDDQIIWTINHKFNLFVDSSDESQFREIAKSLNKYCDSPKKLRDYYENKVFGDNRKTVSVQDHLSILKDVLNER